jgi:hypothetical protein
MGKGFDCVGVTGPERQNDEGAGREEEVVDGAVVDLVEKGRGIGDRFGPGFEAAEDDGIGGGISGGVVLGWCLGRGRGEGRGERGENVSGS